MEESKTMSVQVTTRDIIKPSSPSPNPSHQGSFKLSLLDQFSSHTYVQILLFYKATPPRPGAKGDEVNGRSQRLKSSLSETLSRFYPFAGRLLKDPLVISFNDEGVDYSEAQVLNSSLFDLLEEPDQEKLKLLLPERGESTDLTTPPLLLIQVSFFQCGGMAIGAKFNHKVADAVTICTFLNGWADSAVGKVSPARPDFSASTIFPPTDSLPPMPQIPQNHNKQRTSVKTLRLVFGPSEIATLQAKATSEKNPNPTRFESVSAFLFKTLMLSEKESIPEWKTRSKRIVWSVNLRSRLQPPVPENCFGNLGGNAGHDVGLDGNDMSILADYLRRGTIDICEYFVQALKGGESVPGILEQQMGKWKLLAEMFAGDVQFYGVTSWCKFPFYESDFGWGKPVWVTNGGSLPMPHMIVLMDTRDGNGIEVMVSLKEEEIDRFESDQELKNYASFNPSAAI